MCSVSVGKMTGFLHACDTEHLPTVISGRGRARGSGRQLDAHVSTQVVLCV